MAPQTSSSSKDSSSISEGFSRRRSMTHDLLMWRNPVTSTAVFIGVNLIYFFVFVLGKSFLSLICYFFLFPFAVGLLFKTLDIGPSSSSSSFSIINKQQQKQQRQRQQQQHGSSPPRGEEGEEGGNDEEEDADVEIVSKETLDKSINDLYHGVNKYLYILRNIILWKNPFLSLKCMLLLWLTGYISSFFSFSFLFFLFFWVAFGFTFLKRIIYDSFFVPFITPYIKFVKKHIKQLVGNIPKMEDATKKL